METKRSCLAGAAQERPSLYQLTVAINKADKNEVDKI